jgi:hypothetical protein
VAKGGVRVSFFRFIQCFQPFKPDTPCHARLTPPTRASVVSELGHLVNEIRTVGCY